MDNEFNDPQFSTPGHPKPESPAQRTWLGSIRDFDRPATGRALGSARRLFKADVGLSQTRAWHHGSKRKSQRLRLNAGQCANFKP
jgi:hypothetical protein